ncbi:MAG: TonB-dependent receptor plug domain-containing protein, partial [Novosphingobium sp.]|nr:TonB-dependent receptor plug domain-containing protein [Novosphingobium sp.]
MNTRLLKAALCGSVCVTGFSIPVSAAFAQAEEQVSVAEDNGDTIVVTGSRIRRTEYSTAEPLTVISREEMTQAGFNSAADALQSAAITQGSSQVNNYFGGFVVNGGTGVNTVSLRGLGASRTLVLLNGHRLAPAGTRGSVGAVDTNVLPSALIERIEILKAGASSIYGSDAVAGVVNIITDDKLQGLVL